MELPHAGTRRSAPTARARSPSRPSAAPTARPSWKVSRRSTSKFHRINKHFAYLLSLQNARSVFRLCYYLLFKNNGNKRRCALLDKPARSAYNKNAKEIAFIEFMKANKKPFGIA